MIYLDNSATTKVSDECVEIVTHYMQNQFANPSSIHSFGSLVSNKIETAREQIAKTLGAKKGEIYFTSGGTEANNIAVLGAARALKKRGSHIVCTAVEHASVINTCKQLESEGFEVTYIMPNDNHTISQDDILNSIRKDTVLVSIMHTNNELGVNFPIRFIKKAINSVQSVALVHSDCVQAYTKHPITADSIGADLITVSGHKIGAPKGVGAIYIRSGVRVIPLVYGGGQESAIRSGTENVPAICAFGNQAAKLCDKQTMLENAKIYKDLYDYSLQKCGERNYIQINSLPYQINSILNISVSNIRSETLVHFLEQKNIFISSGSACSSHDKSHKNITELFGYDKKRADSAVRISFCTENTNEQIDKLFCALDEAHNSLVRKD